MLIQGLSPSPHPLMWDITIHPLKEPDDPVGTIEQPVSRALIPNVIVRSNLPDIVCFGPYCSHRNVIARPNLPDIICFGPYRPHGFVLGSHTWSQNASDKLATSTTNKGSNQLLTQRYGILQFTSLKEPDDPVSTIGQPVRSALISNVTARPISKIFSTLAHGPHGFVLSNHA
jgi:hypothetical protein